MNAADVSKYASLVNKKWTLKKVKALVTAEVKSGHMQQIIFNRGWSSSTAEQAVIDYLTCGRKVSIKEFMENYL